jgi:hypothetical protein
MRYSLMLVVVVLFIHRISCGFYFNPRVGGGETCSIPDALGSVVEERRLLFRRERDFGERVDRHVRSYDIHYVVWPTYDACM